MSLDPAYLRYPLRRHGMDHARYGWSNLFDRSPLAWPGGKSVAIAIVVSLEWFPILPSDDPFRAPGHMQTAYPDFRHYTAREYGTRVGFDRMLESFARHGVRASIAVNAAIAERYPALIVDIQSAGHEIVAHATNMNATIASGMDAERHAAIVADSAASLARITGTRPAGWLSIARSQADDTPEILVANQFDYMLDWVNDDLPYVFDTANGRIINLPLNHELSDRQVIGVHQQSMDSYVEQITDAYDWLEDEAAQGGGRMLPIDLTPYISGLPYRIDALDDLLQRLAEKPTSWFATTGAICANARAQLGGG